MDLYFYAPSLFSQKVLMAALEKTIEVNLCSVLLRDPDQKAAYAKIYPIGKVPCLKVAGALLPESSSIVEYFDTIEPQHLLISGPNARIVRHWDRMLDLYLLEPAILCFFQSMKANSDKERISKARSQIDALYLMLEKQLQEAEYLAGDAFSLADITLMIGLDAAEKAVPFTKHANITKYFVRHQHRESFVKVKAMAQPEMALLVKALSVGA